MKQETLPSNLMRQGFTRVVQPPQEFNVLCVTKRKEPAIARFHLPITGTAIVKQVQYVRSDITVSCTTVTFDNNEYELSHIRNGLDGAGLVIGIKITDQGPFDEWELYTDTPSANPDDPDKRATSEELRGSAAFVIGR